MAIPTPPGIEPPQINKPKPPEGRIMNERGKHSKECNKYRPTFLKKVVRK